LRQQVLWGEIQRCDFSKIIFDKATGGAPAGNNAARAAIIAGRPRIDCNESATELTAEDAPPSSVDFILTHEVLQIVPPFEAPTAAPARRTSKK